MSAGFDVQALCGQLDRREISRREFIEACTRLIAETIGCTRAGIWLFSDAEFGPILRCLGVYDRNRARVTYVPDERRAVVDAYFDVLERTGHVLAADVYTHPVTARLFDPASNVNDVRSLMAAAFAINGRLFGAFTCSQAHRTMEWTQAQLAMLKRIGGRASLALGGATQTREATLPMPL
jgi:GAF domain-containing protein